MQTEPLLSKFVRERKQHETYTFKDTAELCGFVAQEIRSSGRTYKDISSKANCCLSTVAKLASGATRFPRVATVFEILRTLGFTVTVRR